MSSEKSFPWQFKKCSRPELEDGPFNRVITEGEEGMGDVQGPVHRYRSK